MCLHETNKWRTHYSVFLFFCNGNQFHSIKRRLCWMFVFSRLNRRHSTALSHSMRYKKKRISEAPTLYKTYVCVRERERLDNEKNGRVNTGHYIYICWHIVDASLTDSTHSFPYHDNFVFDAHFCGCGILSEKSLI